MTILKPLTAIAFIVLALVGRPGLTTAQSDPPANCIAIEQDGGFETEGAWQFANTASPGFLDKTQAHSGAQSAFVGIPADGENQEVDSTVWQEMRLPAAQQITATLWLRSQAGDEGDKRYVVIWDVAADEASILFYEPIPQEDWRQITLDLSHFADKDILLVMGVHNDGGGEKAGAWVDDVSVLACTPATATPDTSPTPTATISPTATATPSPTPTATLRPSKTPTMASSPTAIATPSPAPTPYFVSNPQQPVQRGLPANSALPLLAAVFCSGFVAVVVVVFNLRR